MLKVLRVFLWAVVVTVLAGAAAYVYLERQQRGATQPMVAIGGPFKLAATSGGTIDSATMKGKPFAVFFGFTYCPEVCPTTLYEISSSLGKLGEDAKDLKVFFVTVDPERDTLDFMTNYLTSFDPRIIGLRPSPEELAQIAKSYRVFYEKVPTSDGGYTMNHTALVYLMDREGRFFGTLDFEETPEMRLTKLKRLLKDG